MLKSTFRFLLLFAATATISFVAASSAYFITKNTLSEKKLTPKPDVAEVLQPHAASPEASDMSVLSFDGYVVRLEEDAICVYTRSNHTEEFLYSTYVYRPDLSDEDVALLTSGVTLDTASELTGFMENYTS